MILRFASVLATGILLFGDAHALVALPPLVAPPVESTPGPGEIDITPHSGSRPAPPVAEREPGGNPLWAIPLKQLAGTRERPMFSPSRRPPPPAVVGTPHVAPVATRSAPKPAQPDRPELLLVGTIIGEHDGIGVFVDQATKNVIRLKLGEEHQGWLLRSVQRREATLEKDQETATVAFPRPVADQTTAAVPPPQPKRLGVAAADAGTIPNRHENLQRARRPQEERTAVIKRNKHLR